MGSTGPLRSPRHRILLWSRALGLLIPLSGCVPTSQDQVHAPPSAVPGLTRIVLPATLEERRAMLQVQVDSAIRSITAFAVAHGWDSLVTEPFMDSVMVFDRKPDFDHRLLVLARADTAMELPSTYCGALERRTLLVVAPELYASAYPEGIEPHSWVKLLTHEIAHRLHVRILGGDEEAMGPMWFYEGFAIYAADQLRHVAPSLDSTAMRAAMDDPERGSYAAYGAVFRYFAERQGVERLIGWAASDELEAHLWTAPVRTGH